MHAGGGSRGGGVGGGEVFGPPARGICVLFLWSLAWDFPSNHGDRSSCQILNRAASPSSASDSAPSSRMACCHESARLACGPAHAARITGASRAAPPSPRERLSSTSSCPPG